MVTCCWWEATLCQSQRTNCRGRERRPTFLLPSCFLATFPLVQAERRTFYYSPAEARTMFSSRTVIVFAHVFYYESFRRPQPTRSCCFSCLRDVCVLFLVSFGKFVIPYRPNGFGENKISKRPVGQCPGRTKTRVCEMPGFLSEHGVNILTFARRKCKIKAVTRNHFYFSTYIRSLFSDVFAFY